MLFLGSYMDYSPTSLFSPQRNTLLPSEQIIVAMAKVETYLYLYRGAQGGCMGITPLCPLKIPVSLTKCGTWTQGPQTKLFLYNRKGIYFSISFLFPSALSRILEQWGKEEGVFPFLWCEAPAFFCTVLTLLQKWRRTGVVALWWHPKSTHGLCWGLMSSFVSITNSVNWALGFNRWYLGCSTILPKLTPMSNDWKDQSWHIIP